MPWWQSAQARRGHHMVVLEVRCHRASGVSRMVRGYGEAGLEAGRQTHTHTDPAYSWVAGCHRCCCYGCCVGSSAWRPRWHGGCLPAARALPMAPAAGHPRDTLARAAAPDGASAPPSPVPLRHPLRLAACPQRFARTARLLCLPCTRVVVMQCAVRRYKIKPPHAPPPPHDAVTHRHTRPPLFLRCCCSAALLLQPVCLLLAANRLAGRYPPAAASCTTGWYNCTVESPGDNSSNKHTHTCIFDTQRAPHAPPPSVWWCGGLPAPISCVLACIIVTLPPHPYSW